MIKRLRMIVVAILAVAFVATGCKKSKNAGLKTLEQAFKNQLVYTPQLAVTVNLKAIRESQGLANFLNSSPDMKKDFLAAQKSKDHCQSLIHKIDSVTVIGFSNLQFFYVAVQGTFQSSQILHCMSYGSRIHSMRIKNLMGKKVSIGTNSSWWAGNSSVLIGLIRNSRQMLEKGEASQLENDGLLGRLLGGTGSLAMGTLPTLLNHALVFQVSDFSPIRKSFFSSMEISIRHPKTLSGNVMWNSDIKANVRVEVEQETDAQKLETLFYGLQIKFSKKAQDVFKNLKISRSGKVVTLSYKEKVEKVVSAVAKFKRTSNTSEAAINLKAIGDGAVSWFDSEHADIHGNPLAKHFPSRLSPTGIADSVTITPAQKPCANGRAYYSANSARWESEPWKSLKFGINKKHYFQYVYIQSGTATAAKFTIRAHADLDCNGTYSTFEVRGEVNSQTGEVERTKMIITNAN